MFARIRQPELYITSAALFFYPILLLTLRGGMNGAFFVLLLVALVQLFRNRKTLSGIINDSNLTILSMAMAAPMFAILLSQIFHRDFKAPPYDGASRLLLAVPIFLFLQTVDIKRIAIIQYAFPIGVIGGLITLLLSPYAASGQTYFLNHIHLGDLALMLGFLSVMSINWTRQDALPVVLLKITGLLVSLYVSTRTGARGGWVAIPAFLFIWVFFRNDKRPWRKIGTAAALVLLAAIASYFIVPTIHARIDLIYADLNAFLNGNLDTSIGVRLQLWKAALRLFWENPLFGIGADGFKSATLALANAGFITPTAGYYGGAEVHNEILAHTVRFGIFGLAAILLVYIVPFVRFLKLTRTDSPQKRIAAMMGMCLVIGFFIFGLTVEIFNLKMTIAFYGLTLAVLLAAASNQSSRGENTHV